MLQIIIADDHAVVRTGLQFIFDTTSDMVLAAECRNGAELLEQLKNQSYDVVILDITMPETDAFEVLEQIKSLYPKLPVIVFTMNSDRSFALRMFKKGADAFINKESAPDLLLQAIRSVAQGKKFHTREQIELVMNHISDPKSTQNARHDSLSDREFQILCMLASGMKKLEIASNLSISKNTVNNHRNNIMKKMEFETTADLARYAVTNRLIG
jgi:DNA-binding NarL/FixJ family response regulator